MIIYLQSKTRNNVIKSGELYRKKKRMQQKLTPVSVTAVSACFFAIYLVSYKYMATLILGVLKCIFEWLM